MKKTITAPATAEEVAKQFGVSVDTIKEQYAANAKILGKMKDKAAATGKKVNKYTFEELQQLEANFIRLSK